MRINVAINHISFTYFICIEVLYWLGGSVQAQSSPLLELLQLGSLRQLNEVLRPNNPISNRPTKVVFPVPDDLIKNRRSFLPDLGVLTDLFFLFLPRDFPASGLARLSRDLFESEQCVQFVGCEMTKMTAKYESLQWVRNFLQDFPAQGDFVERLRQGSMDAITRLEEKKKMDNNINGNGRTGKTEEQTKICTFSCNPIKSLTRGLKILSLLNDLVRTVK